LFGDMEALTKIMEPIHQPAVQKAIGRQVENFGPIRWNEICKDVVYKANYAKFTQNPDMKKVLIESEETTLVEASPHDTIWGIGLGEDDPRAADRSQWRGKNWLGEVLMKVREDLLKEDS